MQGGSSSSYVGARRPGESGKQYAARRVFLVFSNQAAMLRFENASCTAVRVASPIPQLVTSASIGTRNMPTVQLDFDS